jgi:hypothetical protein
MAYRRCIAPASIASRPVFSVDGRTLGWDDITAAARLDGSWAELEERTRLGLACQKRLAIVGERIGADVIAEAARRFRYERDLLAGDELAAWLGRWELEVLEWRGYVVRMLARERLVGKLAETGRRFFIDAGEVAAAVWAEAVCSGFLARAADQVAGDAALAAAAGERLEALRQPEELLDRIRTVAARARAEAATEEAIEREVAGHRIDWLRIEGEILIVSAEDAAREAALCFRADGRPLADVAAACGVELHRLSIYVVDADDGLSPALIAAREGELIGPVPRDGAFVLLSVERKITPSRADPNVRQRAVERIVERVAQRALLEHVEWHEHP